jgi:hypothetical protein
MSPRQNNPNQTPLWTTDDVAKSTFKTVDDKAFKAEQRRKRKKHDPYPIPESGPCCFRCKLWLIPENLKDFGECRFLGTADDRRLPFVEKGQVIDRDQARAYGVITTPLPTRGNFACSAFVEAGEHEEAA